MSLYTVVRAEDPLPQQGSSLILSAIALFSLTSAAAVTKTSCFLRSQHNLDLIADMEQLREELAIDQWLVFGGSWGSTPVLPTRKNILSGSPNWCSEAYSYSARKRFSGSTKKVQLAVSGHRRNYLAPIPEDERSDLVTAFHKRLISDDETVRLAAARALSVWEASTSFLHQNADSWKN